MAYVELEKVDDVEAYSKYIMQEKQGVVIGGAQPQYERMAKELRAEKARFPKSQVDNIAYTLYQSFSPEDSKKYTPEEFNQMGRELIEKWAPGHLAFVVTHTDKAHIHNHIVVSGLHSETGRYLKHDGPDITRLHDISNEICRGRGLSEMKIGGKSVVSKLHPTVLKMQGKGMRPWILDLAEKIDAARVLSTGYDEFRAQLSQRGVRVDIGNKYITYHAEYKGKEQAKRGDKLGVYFDKEGLEKAFKENDGNFNKHPGLRAQLAADVRAMFSAKGERVGAASDLLSQSASDRGLGKKDYSKFTKIDRRSSGIELSPVFDERGGPFYLAMKKAREVSIFDYCKEHKIRLTKDKEGKTVLAGRDFVVIESESKWRNTKNGLSGNIIDFVVCHDGCHPLYAVSKLTRNPRLKAFENVIGEYKLDYRAFFVPKPHLASPNESNKVLRMFLKGRGMSEDGAETLLKSERVHVAHDKSIWLMGDKSESALEFHQDSDGKWRSKRHGKPTGAFFEQSGSGRAVQVHRDPLEYLLSNHHREGALHKGVSQFVFLDDNSHRHFEEFLALHQHITDVHIAHSLKMQEHEKQREFAQSLTARFDPFDIRVHGLSRDLGMSKGRGPEIGF